MAALSGAFAPCEGPERNQQAECKELTLTDGSIRGDGAFCRLCCESRLIRLAQAFVPREKETGIFLLSGVEFPEETRASNESPDTSSLPPVPSAASPSSNDVSGLAVNEDEDRILTDLNADMRRCRVA